ncbi:MAG TPA: sulfurylase [Nannocystis exedens]|nr:sulfurylase [Nannocystis exedens]
MADPTPLAIPSAALHDLYRHARAEFPNECCGYLMGEGDSLTVRRCTNRQDQLHALDPKTHPRTAANGYNIGGRELLDLVRSFEGENPVTVIYHSHPRVGAYFSEEDARAAIEAGMPVDYLIIDAQESTIVEAKLFRRDPATQGYICIGRYEGAPI